MREYRVKGLSCANCTQELEGEIQKLAHGQDAILNYNSGKLRVSDKVPLTEIKKILSSEGAAIEAEREHDHDHDHPQAYRITKLSLVAAAILYFTAILLQGIFMDGIVIAMYVFAMAISGYSTFIKGVKNLFQFKFNIDTLMTIALIGAIGIQEWKEATLVAILFGVNELLEGMGMEKARRSMESLLSIAPKEATIIEDQEHSVIPIAWLREGHIVLVRSGERIPSDGVVVEGRSSVNEAAITGESLPVDKFEGEAVFGGSINNEGILKVRIAKAYKDSSLARILHLVEVAQETRTPTELFINRFAKYYTPMIIIIAILVVLVPPLLLDGAWKAWLYQGLAVLIVGCPCALLLSSPIAIVAGITRNARNGILIKGGVFLELLGKIDTLAFDKTGTLTKGEPYVEKVIVYDEHQLYPVAAAIEKSSSHPLAKAIMKEISKKEITFKDAEEIVTIPGQGIVAKMNGEQYWLGNEKNMSHMNIPVDIEQAITQLKEDGLTLVLIADQHHILGIFGITDEIRVESKAVIAVLHRIGIRQTVMLTGDNERTAEKVAKSVGVTQFYGNLLPEEKVEKIKFLTTQGNVAMIGDGINDAPALATAHLGIAMGKGSDSAIETADIVLMQDHLRKLPEAISIAKRVNRIIKLNITIAMGLKIIALLLTVPGLLTLWIAILSDMGATILVTLISLTILIEKR